MQYINHYHSPLGDITMACNGQELAGLWFDGQKYSASLVKEQAQEIDLPVFSSARRWLDIYFSGAQPDFTLPLKLTGSAFRLAVWKILQTIPYGQTITYGEIAKLLARSKETGRMSAQAVGGAVGHNPISIIVPCHRVVGANGSLTGYAGGIERKIKLLELEQIDTGKFYIPKKGTAL